MQQRIGRYQILEEIASGGQGVVYSAFDPDSGQIVAVKVLHPSLTGNRDYLERFRREASMASSINQPNVVKIFEVGEDDGRHFIALELLPENLTRIIEGAGALPIERAAVFAVQIARGLAAAHSLGIVHRDVKPQNVLIGSDGTAKLTDFGIARADILPTLTAIGAMMGTPHYMSPEQARGEVADERSDVYSLGCVLYQMLTGEVPFKGDTPLAVIRRHIEERPRPVRKLRSEVPSAVERVVSRSMEKAADRRYQTPRELVSALEQAVPSVMRSAREPRPEAPRSPPPARQDRPQAVSKQPSRLKGLIGKTSGVILVLWGLFLLFIGQNNAFESEGDLLAGSLLLAAGIMTLVGGVIALRRRGTTFGPLGRGHLIGLLLVGGLVLFIAAGNQQADDQPRPVLPSSGATAVVSTVAPAPTRTSTPAPVSAARAADPATSEFEKPTIRFGDTRFESLWINNAVAQFIIEKGYGYPTETVEMTTRLFQATLPAGEIDIQMEGWQQIILDWYKEEIGRGTIANLGMTYDGGAQFFVIPEWVSEEYNIKTVADMKDHWELFRDLEDPSKGAFINCLIGWQCAEINTVKLEAYGLDKIYNIISPGSSAAMDAALAGAQKKREPVFGYYWAPTALMGMYDWHILEEPEYNDAVWDKITAAREDKSLRPLDQAVAYETLPINKLAWSGLEKKAPDVWAMLKKMNVGLEPLTKTAIWSNENDIQDYSKAAVYYLQNFENRWKTWVPLDIYRKVKAALPEEILDWIVYKARVEGTDHIFRIRPDGSGLTQITTGESHDLYPTWSPDKSRIAFMRQTTPEGEDRYGDIYVINSDGTGLRRLTRGGDYHYPDWSPSEDMIIFDGFGSGIQTVGLIGGDVRSVLNDSLADRPDWSPDGSQVAFHRPGDPGEVFVMNADGSNIRSLGKGFYPDWSPDGSKILFHYKVDGDWDVLVINADGTGFANLTAGRPGDDVLTDWSPDGEEIVFAFREGDTGNWELGIMDAEGGPVTNITNSPADEMLPQW